MPHDAGTTMDTVIVTGRYEELATDPTQPEKPERAYALLKRRPVWWEQVM